MKDCSIRRLVALVTLVGSFLSPIANAQASLHADVFDFAYYTSAYTDVKGMTLAQAQAHWQQKGIPWGRQASPLFAVKDYLALNPHLAEAGVTTYAQAVDYYVAQDLNRGRITSVLLAPDIFNSADYARFNPSLSFPNLRSAQLHWVNTGLPLLQLKASTEFSITEYLQRYPDLRSAYSTNLPGAVRHYIFNGRKAARYGLISTLPQTWYDRETRATISPAVVESGDRVETFTSNDGRQVSVVVKAPKVKGGVVTISPLPAGTDAYLTFKNAIDKIRKENLGTLNIKAGTYTFKTVGGWGHLDLNDLKDVTINGGGATLVFSQPRAGIAIVNSQRLKINYVRLDWQGLKMASPGVIAKDTSTGENILQIDSRYPMTAADKVQAVSYFDTVNRRWTQSPPTELFFSAAELPTYLGSQRFRSPKFAVLPAGTKVLARHLTYEGSGVQLSGLTNEDITLQSVILYSVPGNAFYVQGLRRGLLLSGCTLRTFTEDPLRMISATTDGIHLRDTGGDLIIENNAISGQGDDGVNFAGGVSTLRAVNGTSLDFPTHGNLFEVGNEVTFFNSGLGYLGDATIKSVAKVTVNGESLYRVGIDRAIAGLNRFGAMRNMARSGNRYVLRGNTFKNNRARGAVVQTANGLIENNTFSGMTMNGILLVTDATYWFEGFGAANLIIRNNNVSQTGYTPALQNYTAGAISAVGHLPTGMAMFPFHQRVRIEKNQIANVPGPCLVLSSIRDADVLDNTCTSSNLKASGRWIGDAKQDGSIVISHVDRVSLIGNSRSGSSSGPLQIDSLTSSRAPLQSGY